MNHDKEEQSRGESGVSKLPYLPLAVDAYMADTTHLTLEEHGAYLLLLMAMWRREGAIPDDDRMTGRMLGLMPRAWLRLKARLMPLLSIYGPEGAKMLTQKRLQKEWNNAIANRSKYSEKGKLGAATRWSVRDALSPLGTVQKNGQLKVQEIADEGLQQSTENERQVAAQDVDIVQNGDGQGNGTGYGRPIAPKKVSKKEDLSGGDSEDTGAASAAPEGASSSPSPTDEGIGHLLKTPLMRRTSR